MLYYFKCFFIFQIVDDEISQLVENQNRLESRYEQMVSQKAGMRGGGPAGRGYALTERRAEAHRDAQTLAGELRNATHVFGRGLKQSPLTSDNLEKVQQDRCGTSLPKINRDGKPLFYGYL